MPRMPRRPGSSSPPFPVAGSRSGVAATGGDVGPLLAQARAHHAAGRPGEAEAAYRQVLARAPGSVEALTGLADLALRAGRPQAAVEWLTRATTTPLAVARSPAAAAVWCLLGRAHLACGRPAAAQAALTQALDRAPRQGEAMVLLGQALAALGDRAQAVDWLRRGLRLRKDDPQAHLALATLLVAQGAPAEALRLFARAATLAPSWPPALLAHAEALFDQGLVEQAQAALDKVVAVAPDLVPARMLEARLWDARDHHDAAAAAWDHCLTLAEAAVRAGTMAPDPLLFNDAATFFGADMALDRALDLQRRALAAAGLAPASATTPPVPTPTPTGAAANPAPLGTAGLAARGLGLRRNLVTLLITAGQVAEAEAEARAAAAAHPDSPMAHRMLGDVLMRAGRFAEARQALAAAWTLAPDDDALPAALVTTGRFAADASDTAALGSAILERWRMARGQGTETADLAYAAGKVLDDRRAFDEAFAAYARANALKAAQTPFDLAGHEAAMAAIRATFTPDLFARLAGTGHDSPVPVLVVGLPRSGTTLVEQIIASHPRAGGAGELPSLGRLEQVLPWRIADRTAGRDRARRPAPWPDSLDGVTPADMAACLAPFSNRYLATLRAYGGAGAERVVDKMPANLARLGLFALAFPRGRVIVCRRSLMDTCLSLYFQNFQAGHAYRHDLETLGRVALGAERMVAHWRAVLPVPLLEVEYDALTADPEGESRRMLDFLGLPWDPAVLRFHDRAEQAVATASRWQVRQPVYRSSVARWRRYDPHLAPLRAVLAAGGVVD